jgi:type IV fimbrial biogenesis protein FimT
MLIHREALVAYIKGCKNMQHTYISSIVVDGGQGHHAHGPAPSVCKNQPSVLADSDAIQHFICTYKPFVGLRSNLGFTLIELMFGLLVLAILATVAIPSIQPVIRKNRLTTETNRLVTDFSFARSEAITRAVPVTLCTSTSGATCDGTPNWANGRLIWADFDGNSALTAASDEIRRFSEAPSGEATITDNNVPDPIVYQSRGFPIGVGVGGASSLDITVNGLPATEFRELCINATGQTRLRRTSSDPAC